MAQTIDEILAGGIEATARRKAARQPSPTPSFDPGRATAVAEPAGPPISAASPEVRTKDLGKFFQGQPGTVGEFQEPTTPRRRIESPGIDIFGPSDVFTSATGRTGKQRTADAARALKETPTNLKIGTLTGTAGLFNAFKKEGLRAGLLLGFTPEQLQASEFRQGDPDTGGPNLLGDILGQPQPLPGVIAGQALAVPLQVPRVIAGKGAVEVSKAAGKRGKKLSKKAAIASEEIGEVTLKDAPITRLLRPVTQNVPNMGAAIGISFLTGDPTLAIGILSASESGNSFQEQLGAGGSLEKSIVLSDLSAAAEFGGEMIVFPKLFKGLKEGVTVRQIVNIVSENAGQEGLTGFLQGFLDVFGKETTKGTKAKEAAIKGINAGIESIPENAWVGGVMAGGPSLIRGGFQLAREGESTAAPEPPAEDFAAEADQAVTEAKVEEGQKIAQDQGVKDMSLDQLRTQAQAIREALKKNEGQPGAEELAAELGEIDTLVAEVEGDEITDQVNEALEAAEGVTVNRATMDRRVSGLQAAVKSMEAGREVDGAPAIEAVRARLEAVNESLGEAEEVSGAPAEPTITPEKSAEAPAAAEGAINVYKTTDGDITGLQEADVELIEGVLVDKASGKPVILDTEASGSAIAQPAPAAKKPPVTPAKPSEVPTLPVAGEQEVAREDVGEPAPAVREETKTQPWEFTLAEWRAKRPKSDLLGQKLIDFHDAWDSKRSDAVRDAVADGKSVPRNILQELKSRPFARDALAKAAAPAAEVQAEPASVINDEGIINLPDRTTGEVGERKDEIAKRNDEIHAERKEIQRQVLALPDGTIIVSDPDVGGDVRQHRVVTIQLEGRNETIKGLELKVGSEWRPVYRETTLTEKNEKHADSAIPDDWFNVASFFPWTSIESGFVKPTKAKKPKKPRGPRQGDVTSTRISKINKDILAQETKDRSLEEIVKSPNDAQENLVAERQRLIGGRQAGGTTIIPDMAAELHEIGIKFYRNPQKMARAATNMVIRNLQRATNYMRTLGSSGKKLADDVDQITFRITKNTNIDLQDLRNVYKGLGKAGREQVSKVINGRLKPSQVSKRIQNKAVELRRILDRSMNAASDLEMERTVQGKRIPIGGAGKAYPQALNRKGVAFTEEAAAQGQGSARVFAWAQSQVTAGNYDSVDAAITALQNFRDKRLRGVNTYLESERIELPEEFIEWDGLHTLPILIERNWTTVEGVRQWGKNFGLARSRIEKIKAEHGVDNAYRVDLFIETSFGIRSIASEDAKEASRQIRGFQFITKVGLSPLTIMRNMTDRIAKGFTISPLSTIKTFVKYPPFINQFIRSSQKHEDWMIRSGAVFGHGSLSEGYEAGSVLTELASAPFSASERGNQVFIAMVRYDKLLRDISTLKGKDKVLARIMKPISFIWGSGEKALKFRIGEAGGEKVLEKALAGEELSQEDIEFMLHVTVRDKAFPMVLSTKPIWYDNHPFVKVLAQFKTWPMQQLNMIWRDVIKYTVKTGDPTRLIGFLVGTLIAGEIYNIMRDFLFDKEESILSQFSKDPKEREVAWAIIEDLLDGGVVGMLADFSYGIKDWVAGVSANTAKNVWDTALHIKKTPRLTPQALERLLEKEVTPYRQIKRLADKFDRKLFNENNISKQHYKWRAEGWKFRDAKKNPTAMDQVAAYTDRVLMGSTDYGIGENTLALELASRQIIVGDVGDAAKYLKVILRDADDRKATIKSIRSSKTSRSPIGRVAQKDRAKFFKDYSVKSHKEALAVQAKYLQMYEKALLMAATQLREEK